MIGLVLLCKQTVASPAIKLMPIGDVARSIYLWSCSA